MEYQLIIGDTKGSFENDVNRAYSEGWRAAGDVCVVQSFHEDRNGDRHSENHYYQALERTKPDA